MKNKQKIIIWLMLLALLFAEVAQLVSVGSQIAWAQETSESLETTKNQENSASTQLQSGETTETSQTQAQTSSQQEENEGSSKTRISTEETVAESSTKEEAASQTLKTSIQTQAGNVDDNPGASVAFGEAKNYWLNEITNRFATAKLGNYVGAKVNVRFYLPCDNAPVTKLYSDSRTYYWLYKSNVYFTGVDFDGGGDGITITGNTSLATLDGVTYNYFNFFIERKKAGKVTFPSLTFMCSGDVQADEYAWTNEWSWNKVDYYEKASKDVTLTGLTCDLESGDMPSQYSWIYDKWRKASIQTIANNLSNALKSNYRKLGKNVNDTVNFTVESKASESIQDTVTFSGDYVSDLSQFQVNLSSNFSNYVQLEKTGSTGTQINYRMKRIKAGDVTGNCSLTLNTRHDAEGRTMSIYDGSLFYWALPITNIPLDSISVDFTDDQQIWADPLEQTIVLGAGVFLSEIPDVSKMITNVRLEDGTPLNASEYTAQIVSCPTFDNMAITEKIVVELTRKTTGVVSTVNVPVKMSWGNTIQLRGVGNHTTGAYTLHKAGGSYYVRSSYGENKGYVTSGIHNYFTGTPYQSITLLRGTGRIDQLNSTYYKEFNGEVTTNEVVNSFSAQQEVQIGDVVKIWHKEQHRNTFSHNGSYNIKYADEGEGETYFAVTDGGFVPYRLNKLEPKEMTISTTTSNSELDQKKGDMIDFKGMSGNGLKVSKITEYPDRSNMGTSKGKVLVEETISNVTHTYEYEVSFKVTDDRQIWADPVEQTIELGTWTGELAVDKMVTNVRLDDGTVLDSSEYTAKVAWAPNLDNLTVTDKIEVELTRNATQAVTKVQVPVKVTWGNTIQLRGVSNKTTGAYTLHKIGDSYYIRSSYGENKNYAPAGIHNSFVGTPYQSITLLRGTGRIDQLASTYDQKFNGDETTDDIVNNFGTNKQQLVQVGDVVKIWHKEQWRNTYVKNGAEINYLPKDEAVAYFAVTEKGFEPYRLNQLEPKEMTILSTMTDEELDKQAGDMIDFKGMNGNGLKVSKITEYPDRSKTGTSKGKVLVEETIANVTRTYEYEVTFHVLADLNVSAKQIADIPLGTTLSNDAKEYVTVTSTPEDEGQLTFEWVSDPISGMAVGTHQATVRVTSPTYQISKEITIDYKVLYGNTIVMGNNSTIALSLLTNGGAPKLVASSSSTESKLSLRPSIGIYRNSLVNSLTSLKTDTVYQKPEQLAETWNSSMANQNYSYGDVLVASAFNRDDTSWSLRGAETYVSRNEMLVKESEGYDDAFYELTPTGYSLLHINRLTSKLQEIEQGTTEEELDKRVSEFLSTENYDNIQVKGFSMYPDTSKVGGSTSIITVSETLKSGGTFDYEYPVSFLIKAPNLTLTTNLSVTNLSRTEEETKVGDELLYVYTLTNDSPIGLLKAGNLSVALPEGLETETPSDLTVPLTELAVGETVTHQFKVKVTEKALDQNPVVKVTGKATNESTVEQEIPETTVEVPGSLVSGFDPSEINLTIPTKMNFGAEKDQIISPVYKMENNSTTPVEVMVDQFTPDQNLKGKNLLLNVTSEGQSVTLYENEQGINQLQFLLTLGSEEIKQLSFSGSVNQQTEVSKSSSTLRLRFKTIK
ncbi:hypothetical protein [Candidatus Enterococcus courvalinii]|uniref:Uncharacterized protein n=1 Tax=Candidatus Enterococcus courvalinii TaxID=2815329 RepID=A0ABS3I2B4_9ENTE|nr:hypothetical protein [Enterococcus sp. MSG2901]MBO0482460.1 hypothetical protein [Enterococcus sp. MSG2901]